MGCAREVRWVSRSPWASGAFGGQAHSASFLTLLLDPASPSVPPTQHGRGGGRGWSKGTDFQDEMNNWQDLR